MIIRVDSPLSPIFLTDSQSKRNKKKSIKMDTTVRDMYNRSKTMERTKLHKLTKSDKRRYMLKGNM